MKTFWIQLMALLAGCSAQTWGQANANQIDEDVVHRLHKIYSSIETIEGAYSLERIPTETFVNAFARDTKRAVPDVRAQFTSHVDVRWAWKATGERFLETTRLSEGREVDARTTLAFDGAQHIKIQVNPTLEGALPITTTDVGKDILFEYGASATIEPILGLDLRVGTGKSLVALLTESGKVLTEDGGDGLVHIDVTFDAGESQNRLTGTLDARKGFVIVSMRRELMRENRWQLITARESSEFEKADGTVAGAAYWFPGKTVTKTSNVRDEHTFTETVTIKDIRVNAVLGASQFRPQIPIGSQVHDAKTGAVSFQGNRASAEIDSTIAARVEQAKRQAQSLPLGASTATARAPSGLTPMLATVAAVVGLGSLVAALWFWFRVRSH